jgi:hypothetical protein
MNSAGANQRKMESIDVGVDVAQEADCRARPDPGLTGGVLSDLGMGGLFEVDVGSDPQIVITAWPRLMGSG